MNRLLPGRVYNPGDKVVVPAEPHLDSLAFDRYKFNNRICPSKPFFITNFSEFGCEAVSAQYCIPSLVKNNPGSYFVGVGWHGREYLYRHLLDEFWEIKEDFQWLREYADAFAHHSVNLKRFEKILATRGKLARGAALANICVGNRCRECRHFWGGTNYDIVCPKCSGGELSRSLFASLPQSKALRVPIPPPSSEKKQVANGLIPDNCVGVFARGRRRYGRNLSPEFYQSLIKLLNGMGHPVVWFGEKQSVQKAPAGVIDCSGVRDLEQVIACIGRCQFTVQFWTASTRLAAMAGVPWLVFESPDQIVGPRGQEGMRLALTSDPKRNKLVIAHYCSVLEDPDGALKLVEKSVVEMRSGDFSIGVGMVCYEDFIRKTLVKARRFGFDVC